MVDQQADIGKGQCGAKALAALMTRFGPCTHLTLFLQTMIPIINRCEVRIRSAP